MKRGVQDNGFHQFFILFPSDAGAGVGEGASEGVAVGHDPVSFPGGLLVVLLGVEEGGDCAHAPAPENELLDVFFFVEIVEEGFWVGVGVPMSYCYLRP